jgi:hypothetical protein
MIISGGQRGCSEFVHVVCTRFNGRFSSRKFRHGRRRTFKDPRAKIRLAELDSGWTWAGLGSRRQSSCQLAASRGASAPTGPRLSSQSFKYCHRSGDLSKNMCS